MVKIDIKSVARFFELSEHSLHVNLVTFELYLN